ncbi:MAG: acyltransferase [Bacteroidota bacterium]
MKIFNLLRKLGMNYSEKTYSNVTLITVVKKVLITYRNAFLLKYILNSVVFSPINPRLLRPKVLRCIGCKVGKKVFIGSNVHIDSGYAGMLIIEDNVHIAGHCIFLCHQRDLSNYFIGDDYSNLGYKIEPIHLKRGCLIGMNSLVLPGVTIGEGAIVGAGSLVVKNIPDWTIATGRPAKVVKNLVPRP